MTNEQRREYARRYYATPEQKQKRREYDARVRAEPNYVAPVRSRPTPKPLVRAAQLRYRLSEKGRAKKVENDRKYARANPDMVRIQKHRHEARKRNAPGRGVTISDWRSCVNGSMGLCTYCNGKLALTMDHVDALARGGAHDPENIAAVCRRCNSAKGDRPLVVFLVHRLKRIARDRARL